MNSTPRSLRLPVYTAVRRLTSCAPPFAALDEQADAEEEQAALQVAADTAAIAAFLARNPGDPRDMTSAEVLACLNSADPDKHRALGEHFQALCDDIDNGKVKTVNAKEALARISTELGLD